MNGAGDDVLTLAMAIGFAFGLMVGVSTAAALVAYMTSRKKVEPRDGREA